MSIDKGTLTIDEDLLLCESHATVQAVINKELKHDKLIINRTTNAFDKNFIGSAVFETFWKILGESVVTLELHERAPVDLELYISNLHCLCIKKPEIFQFISPKLYEKNVALEVLNIKEKLIIYTTNEEKPDINETFIKILQLSTSLKSLTFECSILLNIVMKLFFDLNTNFWGMDEVIVDCEPLPQYTDYINYIWIIEMVEMEFVRLENTTKLIIKPLSIREKIIVTDGCKIECQTNCILNHRVFKSDSVVRFTFEENLKKCYNYYRTCVESFPSLVKVTHLYFDDVAVLNLMSERLNSLTNLSFYYYGPLPNTWPTFPKMEAVAINFKVASYKSFEGCIKSFPNLTKLLVKIDRGIHVTDDDCAKIITENLKNLEFLFIKGKNGTLTSIGLDLIGYKLQKLKELHISCLESFSNFEKLFDELPQLEVLWYGHSFLLRRFINVESMPLSKEKQIIDLPPEILEQIFLYLNIKEQRNSSQVSKFWFNIISSSPNIDRTINLGNSYLSCATKPVKIFANTEFKYNAIIFENTSCAKDEDLTRFWERIGTEVEEICMKDRSLNVIEAFETGLKARHLPKLKRLTIEILPIFYELIHEDIPEWKLLLNRIESLSVNYLYQRVLTQNVEFSMSNVTQLTVDGCMNETILAFFERISFPKVKTLIILHVSYESIDLVELFQTKFNFGQLKTLFIGKYYQWHEQDFELILRNCSNVEILGIGLITKFEDFSNYIHYEMIAKLMFDNLLSLNGLYFVIFKNTQAKRYKTYLRTGFGFAESGKSCRVFDAINSSLEN